MKTPLPMHGTIGPDDWKRGLLAARRRRVERLASLRQFIATATGALLKP